MANDLKHLFSFYSFQGLFCIYTFLCDVYTSFVFVIGLLCDVEFLVFFICYRYQSFDKIMIYIVLSGFHRMKKTLRLVTQLPLRLAFDSILTCF